MDNIELLKQYKELLDSGVLTQEEFDAKKAEILSAPAKEDKSLAGRLKKSVVGETSQKITKTNETDIGEIKAVEVKEETEEEKAARIAAEEAKKAEEEAKKAEKAAKKAEKKMKIKKTLKKVGIAFIILILVCVLFSCIADSSKEDLSSHMDKTQTGEIHGMTYNAPADWQLSDEASSETKARYIFSKDGENLAMLEVEYVGESDLLGDAAFDDESHPIADDIDDVLTVHNDGSYQDVNADNAVFEVTVYSNEDETKNQSTLLGAVCDSFKVDEYKNPRESKGLKVSYSGDTKAGTTVTQDSEDLEVKQVFDTGVNEGYMVPDWTLKENVKFKAGKTSTITVIVGDEEKSIDVECSTMSESQYKAKCKELNYKNQLRKESNGEYIKIYGQVLQDCGSGYFRISSGGSGYDNVYMVLALGSDIVEDDWVTCYGVTSGIYSYETVMGATQKVPSMIAMYTDRK